MKKYIIAGLIIWLPFLFYFAPATLMMEPYHPWYYPYTTPLFLISAFFYYPSAIVVMAIQSFSDAEQIGIYRLHFAAFCQSILMSIAAIYWMKYRKQKTEPSHPANPRNAGG